jgi:hypothetical protein
MTLQQETQLVALNPSDQGKIFVEQLKRLADATEKRMKFEKTRAIADLPEKTIEETVNTIFRPYSASCNKYS